MAPESRDSNDLGDWLSAEEAAAELKRFRRKDGKPSVGAIYNLIYRGKLLAKKVVGRVMIHRSQLRRLIELSPETGG